MRASVRLGNHMSNKPRVRCFKGEGGKCVQCGVLIKPNVIRTCKAGSRPQKWSAGYSAAPPLRITFRGTPKPAELDEKQEKYLGDYTKKVLDTIHAKKHYIAIKKRLGFAPTCNCDARQRWLNDADKLARELSRRGVDRLKDWLRRWKRT